MRLSQAPLTGAQVLRDCEFSSLGRTADSFPGMLTFCGDLKYLQQLLKKDNVAAVLVPDSLSAHVPQNLGLATCANPKAEFFKLHNRLGAMPGFLPDPFPTRIGQGCQISPLAVIAPYNVIIGDNTVIEEFVTVRERTTIGSGCKLKAGCRLGGFGFQSYREDGHIIDVNHYGRLILGDRVTVNENSNIHRGLFLDEVTSIGDDTKIDALVYIAHNCHIGKACLLVSGTVVSGAVDIGDNVEISPGVVLSNRIRIGDKAHLMIGSTVVRSVKPGQQVSGNFAVPHDNHLRAYGEMLHNLDEI